MSEHDEKRGGSVVAIGCVLMLVCVPVVYVLGLGPAAYIADKFPATYNFIHVVYAPISSLGANCQPVHKVIVWYLGVWGY